MKNKALEIPLKITKNGVARTLPANLNDVIEQEYASSYLETMGATPTRENIDYVLKHFPLQEALVFPLWARETICVVPGMTEKEANATNLMQSLTGAKNNAGSDDTNTSEHIRNISSTSKALPQTISNSSGNGKIKITKNQSTKSKQNSTPHTPSGRRVSWCTVETLESLNIFDSLLSKLGIESMLSDDFQNMITPLSFTEEQLGKPISVFCASIVDYTPLIKQDTSGKLFDNITGLLSSSSAIKLFGLLSHFCYWNIIHPCSRRSLLLAQQLDPGKFAEYCKKKSCSTLSMMQTQNGDVEDENVEGFGFSTQTTSASDTDIVGNEIDDDDDNKSLLGLISLSSDTSLTGNEKENLYVQLESVLTKIYKKMGYSKYALSVGHQALVSCCHFVVDEILMTMYPWLGPPMKKTKSSKGIKLTKKNDLIGSLRLQLRRLIHQSISDIVDPSRVFTSSMLTCSLVGEHKPMRSNHSKTGLYCTSIATRAVFGDAKNHDTRRMLSLGGGIQPYVNIPGITSYTHENNRENNACEELNNMIAMNEYPFIPTSTGDDISVDSINETNQHIQSYRIDNDQQQQRKNHENYNNKHAIFPYTSSPSAKLLHGKNIHTSSSSTEFLPPLSKKNAQFINATIQATRRKLAADEIDKKNMTLLDQLRCVKSLRSRIDFNESSTSDIEEDLMMRQQGSCHSSHIYSFHSQQRLHTSSSNILINNNSTSSSTNSLQQTSIVDTKPKLDFHNLFDPDSNIKSKLNLKKDKKTTGSNNAYQGFNKVEQSALLSNKIVDFTFGKEKKLNNNDDNYNANNRRDEESLHSMAANSRAEVEISLKAKTSLMSLIVDRTAEHYSKRNITSQFGRTLNANHRQDLLYRKNVK